MHSLQEINASSIYTDAKSIFVKKYAYGGMSSGEVNMFFWREEILPLLLHGLAKGNIRE